MNTEPSVEASYDHAPLIEYLQKVFPPPDKLSPLDFKLFCAHSPGANVLRWYSLQTDISDLYATESLSRDLDIPMMPPEKLVIMPKASDLFSNWSEGKATGWIPLFTCGAFLFVANYDPFEPLPAGIPSPLIKKVLVTANTHDGLLENFKAVLVDFKRKAPPTPFPEEEAARISWLAKLDLSNDEVMDAMKLLRYGLIPIPIKDLSLKLQLFNLDMAFCLQYQAFPFFKFQNNVYVASSLMAGPLDTESLRSQLEYKMAGSSIILVPAEPSELASELELFTKPPEIHPDTHLVGQDPQGYLDVILGKAFELKVSDVHFEPEMAESRYRIRFRLDGVLVSVGQIDNTFAMQVLNTIKIQANIDISERRQPQDGSFSHSTKGQEYDIRVSLIPQYDGGERVVLRILDNRRVPGSLEELGFATSDILLVNKALSVEHGMFLVTGPTGSGKTTTLYSALKSLPLDTHSLQTVEDPVEYKLEGCAQYAVNKQLNLTYDRILRHMLRADPDFILIGEIRDADTAQVACTAANTGHLVLSTMHANDSLSSLYRLRDFGVAMPLLLDVVRLILSQRLLRRLCRKCRFKKDMSALERTAFLKNGYPAECLQAPLFAARGCHACNYSGYRQRFAVVESLFFSDTIVDAILAETPREQMQKLLAEQKFSGMFKTGLASVLRGETSMGELSSLSVRA